MATYEHDKKHNKEEKRETKRLEWEPEDLPAMGRIGRISSIQLAIKIREKFQLTFHDCIGCYIGYTNNFEVTLFFEYNPLPVPEGKIRNLINYSNGEGVDTNNCYQMKQVVDKKFSGKAYELSDDTKELLSDFMYGGRNAFSPNSKNWGKFIHEAAYPAGNIYQPRAERVVIKVTGLDLRVLCRELFGKRMVTDTVVEGGNVINKTANAFYELRYIPVPMVEPGAFMINVEQFDKDAVEEITKRENPRLVQSQGLLMY